MHLRASPTFARGANPARPRIESGIQLREVAPPTPHPGRPPPLPRVGPTPRAVPPPLPVSQPLALASPSVALAPSPAPLRVSPSDAALATDEVPDFLNGAARRRRARWIVLAI